MASIFTFDPDPPRVSSPWATPPLESRSEHPIPQDSASNPPRSATASQSTPINFNGITKLEAEPQEGPTEYKLHLLLRRRRSFVRASTGQNVSGSLRRAETPTLSSPVSRSVSESGLQVNTTPPLSSIQSKQHRLEQLTTQLLWRLQQSCPYHISSSTAPVLPHLPDEAQLSVPTVPQRLLPGLEESKGALYEIGVADDGTFVGLAEDEMDESLNNLRAMAASLGCRVDVLRMVPVGECEWIEESSLIRVMQRAIKTGKLWVAEAFVRPDPHLIDHEGKATLKDSGDGLSNPAIMGFPPGTVSNEAPKMTQQLRVSLTGATMSGKSSLLGTLSTATLDNGRGKSRLSLLKHRHEIVSGMTSSVTQELIGYRNSVDHDGTILSSQVISYGAGNVSSWVDIHSATEGGRLVLLSDSAGHPRFRRTTVRGLVGWDPHWTLLCIPADNTEDSSGKIGASPNSQDILGPAAVDVDLSQAHLQLCLNLELPLVVIITKLDLATKLGLRQTLSKVLSTLKDAKKKPCILRDSSNASNETDLNTISANDLRGITQDIETLKSSPLTTVPIILTSAVKGAGISKLHALLRELPLPATSGEHHATPGALFYIEDVYSNTALPSKAPTVSKPSSDPSAVVGGHLRQGKLHIGDELMLGPYLVDPIGDDSDSGSGRGSTPPNRSQRTSQLPPSRSFPGALHKDRSGNMVSRSGAYANDRQAEWRRVRVISIRNLRLPVRTLYTGQVGTIGVTPLDFPIHTPALVRIRKGLVLTNGELQANRVIVVRFSGTNAGTIKHLSVGSAVVVYVASVRASAKVVSVATEGSANDMKEANFDVGEEEEVGAFGFGFDEEDTNQSLLEDAPTANATIVTFQFIASREFVEMDAKVLVLPGGGPGLFGGNERGEKGVAGFEGFVGRVVERYG